MNLDIPVTVRQMRNEHKSFVDGTLVMFVTVNEMKDENGPIRGIVMLSNGNFTAVPLTYMKWRTPRVSHD